MGKRTPSPYLKLRVIVSTMSILMVKKILLDGSPCGKCAQAEEILKKRGYWNRIDSVVIADEADSESEGMKLAAGKKIDLAPFFIVRDDTGEERLYTRVFEFIKKELELEDSEKIMKQDIDFNVHKADKRFREMSPPEILKESQEVFGGELILAFSGAEDVVLIDMASKNSLPFSVFCLDTGRLHSQTYTYIDAVRKHYGIKIEIYTPSAVLLEPYLNEKGMNSFYSDGHSECCGIRKVEPLKRALKNRKAWVTGLRRDQSPSTRSNLHYAEQGNDQIIKINPLLDWDSARVWEYIRINDVPYNPLHDKGYRSIGCEPCTRPSRPGEHERAARWWWEDGTQRECGLHLK
ncbi:MAG: phosphoadenylyl-sulfate reductase [Spirochaetaceae bacterium]|nr:phosphoadenylyl-sulfate reductase [Spirochaetaceae bacterium]